jgi:uncharacterized membrane protein
MGSIALNLFLIGLVVGPLLGQGPAPERQPPGFPPMHGPGFIFDRMARDLPTGDAQKLRSIFDEERQNLGLQHKAMRQTMKNIADLMKEEKPDIVALRAALDEIRGLGQGFHAGMARALERIVTELPAESRRKIADRIAKAGPPEEGKDRGALPPFDQDRPPSPPEEALPPR